MSALEVLYLLIAVAVYFLYTRRMAGGRKFLGALLWPALLVMAVRDGFTLTKSSSRRLNMRVHDKGIERPVAEPEPAPGEILNLPQYGGIDSIDE